MLRTERQERNPIRALSLRVKAIFSGNKNNH